MEDDPLKTLIVVDHVGDQLLLELSVVLGNVLIESLMSTTDLDHGLASSKLTVLSVWSNQVKLVSNVNDWNGDVLLVDNGGDSFIELFSLSWLKDNWCLAEKFITLLLKLGLCNLEIGEFINVVLILDFLLGLLGSPGPLGIVLLHLEKSLSFSLFPGDPLLPQPLLLFLSALLNSFSEFLVLQLLDLGLDEEEPLSLLVNLGSQSVLELIECSLVVSLDNVELLSLLLLLILQLLSNLGILSLGLGESVLLVLDSLL